MEPKLPKFIEDLLSKLFIVKEYFPRNYKIMIEKYFIEIENEKNYQNFVNHDSLIRKKIKERILDPETLGIINQKLNHFFVRYLKQQKNSKFKYKKYHDINPTLIYEAHVDNFI